MDFLFSRPVVFHTKCCPFEPQMFRLCAIFRCYCEHPVIISAEVSLRTCARQNTSATPLKGLQKLLLCQPCIRAPVHLTANPHPGLSGLFVCVNLMGTNLYLTVALICIFWMTRDNAQLFNFYWLFQFNSSILPMCFFANFDLFVWLWVVWLLLTYLRIKVWHFLKWLVKTDFIRLWSVLSISVQAPLHLLSLSLKSVFIDIPGWGTSVNTGEVDAFQLVP